MRKDRKCIICRKKYDKFSKEHIIPEVIGGSFHINSVCKSCNDRMGSNIDIYLTNKFIISVIYRNKYGIKGKSGKIPPVIESISCDKGRKINCIWDGFNKPYLKYINTIIDTDSNDGVITIKAPDLSSAQKAIKSIERKHPNGKFNITELSEYDKNIKVPISLSMEELMKDRNQMYIALLKIAYEFAVEMVPDYFEDEEAKKISKILYSFERSGKVPDEYFREDIFKEEIKISDNGHLLMLISTDNGLACRISLFNAINSIVKLSDKVYSLKGLKTVLLSNVETENKNSKLLDIMGFIKLSDINSKAYVKDAR